MKYSATILLFTAVAFWSSASARPHNVEQQGVIDAFTRWAIAEMEQLPEPHKTKLINRLHEAQQQHWDNLMEYMAYVQSMLVRYVRESGIEFSRRKRDVDHNDIDDSFIYDSGLIYPIYARLLVYMAPPAHQEALGEKYRKALEEDYESFDDFQIEAIRIFEEETGLDFKKIEAEYEGSEAKQSEVQNKLTDEFINALKAGLDDVSSSEED